MKIIAFTKDVSTIKKILGYMGEPTEAPQFERSRGPPKMGNELKSDNLHFDPIFDDVT